MQIHPKDAPSIPTAPNSSIRAPQSSRERAIAALLGDGGNKQQSPVSNPTSVSPEEMTAISRPSQSVSQESQPQTDTSVGDASPAAESSPKPAEVKAGVPEESPQLSSQFAQLARKEKAVRAKVQAQEAAFKAREAELAAKEEAFKAKESDYQSKYIPKDRFQDDPLQALNDLGLSYDQITQLMLNGPKPEELRVKQLETKLEAQLQSIREQQDKAFKMQQDQQKQAYDQALNQYRNETKSLVDSDPNFETIKATGSEDEVVNLIRETFEEEGRLLTVEEAAQAVEDYLVEEAMKLAKLKKIQQKLAPAPSPSSSAPKSSEPKPEIKQQQGMKTLTNAVGTSRQLSAKERAILAFKGELKN